MATLGRFRAVAHNLPDQVLVVVRDHYQEMITLGQFRAVIDGLPDEVPLEVAIRGRWHFNALLGDLPVTGVTVTQGANLTGDCPGCTRHLVAGTWLPGGRRRVMQKPPAGIPRPASAQVRGSLAILIAGSA